MTEHLPTDLILEIILKLPSKSIARCRCLSKLWSSTLASPYFTDSFLTRSKTRPRLLFAVHQNAGNWLLYSSPYPQISSISVTAEYHMSLPKPRILEISPPVSGLFYFPSIPDYKTPILCNPSTGHLFGLPQLTNPIQSFFGYDPINKQFSVLAVCRPDPSLRLSYQILKLESGRRQSCRSLNCSCNGGLLSNYRVLKLGCVGFSWRSLNSPLQHSPFKLNICINGVLYYLASLVLCYPHHSHKIVCFDLSSEEFKFIDVPWYSHTPNLLVNFNGKLGGIKRKWIVFGEKKCNIELSLWVLEDTEKQEWSKHVYLLPLRDIDFQNVSIVGVTATGEVVLSLCNTTLDPLYVCFFNVEKNTLHKVEIKGFEGSKFSSFFYANVDYVEDLKDLNWS